MASSKEYLEFVLEQLAELDEITYRAMYDELPAPKPKKKK